MPDAVHDVSLSTFTDRELSVLRLLMQGRSNKDIGTLLDITEGTVKVHLKNVLRKLRLNNRTQAAIWAAKNGL